MTTILTRERCFPRAALIGVWWGIGHSVALFVVGGGIVLSRVVVPARVGLTLELGVAAMLIVLGFRNLAGRPAGGEGEGAGHSHRDSTGRQPFLVGMVRGLAGSAAVALPVLATIPTVLGGFAYLAVFGVGTILGMTTVTAR